MQSCLKLNTLLLYLPYIMMDHQHCHYCLVLYKLQNIPLCPLYSTFMLISVEQKYY